MIFPLLNRPLEDKLARLRGDLQLAVIIAMVVVRVMQVILDQVINVISMWNSLVAAVRAMNVILVVSQTVVVGSAGRRIGTAHLNLVLVDMIALNTVQMAVVKIVNMAIVLHRCMTAGRTMSVVVAFVCCAGLIHRISPF
jgi:hypothetical protein